jgi:hypothetical protein
VSNSVTCPIGTFYATAANATADRFCSDCVAGSFSATTTDSTSTGTILTECPAVSNTCPAGTFYKTASSLTADIVCMACEDGFYQATSTTLPTSVQTQCATAVSSTCDAGTFYKTAANASADRECSECSAGTFSASTSVSTVSTSTGNILTKCADASTSCPAGTFYKNASTTTTDVVCTTCGAYFYQATSTDPLTSTVLDCTTPVTICPDNYKFNTSTYATPTTDTVCACAKGAYLQTAPAPQVDAVCTVCGNGYYAGAITPFTSSTVPTSECPSTAAIECPAGTFLLSKATPVFNAACLPCTNGVNFSNTTTDATSNGVELQACPFSATICKTGEAYDNMEATGSADAVCACKPSATSNQMTGAELTCTAAAV